MKAEEKAINLFEVFHDQCYHVLSNTGDGVEVSELAKKSALICIHEIIACMDGKEPDYLEKTYWHPIDFWQEVKSELEKL